MKNQFCYPLVILTLLLLSCDRKNVSSPIKETESQLSNKIDFFPEGFFFRVDGEIAGTMRRFTCECAVTGNCYPVLSNGPKGLKPSCLSEGCSNCNLVLHNNKNSKWDIEIGDMNFIKSMEEIGIKAKGIEGKKIKPITSYIRFKSMVSASSEDFLNTEIQQEIKDLEKSFYTDLVSKETIPFPKIDFNTGIPEGYQAIALELKEKHFIMIVPKIMASFQLIIEPYPATMLLVVKALVVVAIVGLLQHPALAVLLC